DILIAENLSTWQVTEPQNQVMNHLRRTLAHAGTTSIPALATNYCELCESQYTFYDLIDLRTHYFEFSGTVPPEMRSAPVVFSTFDYSAETPTSSDASVRIQATTAGVVNSLRLTSPLVVSPAHHFNASDSLMPPVVVPLESDIHVDAGDWVTVTIRY